MNGVDLVTGWNSLWSLAPPGLGIALATFGAAILVWFVGSWAWQKRKGGGGGMSGFPLMAVVIAAILAGPAVVFPVILGILGVLINLGIAIANFFVGLF